MTNTIKYLRVLWILTLLCTTTTISAESAKGVLDKASAAISKKGGVSASFVLKSAQMGETSGKISVKGKKFHASTPLAIVWFDGKTQWTYIKKNDEVNVSNPSEAELQAINPYNFINMYKKGYKYTMKTTGNTHIVHLNATDKKRSVQEMYITVNKSTYIPTEVKMRQGSKWITISISNFKATPLNDSMFRFNAKDFPNAEVIDLR